MTMTETRPDAGFRQEPEPRPTSGYLNLARRFTDTLADATYAAAWSVTRACDDLYTVLHTSGAATTAERFVGAWQDSVCVRMVNDEGPRIAPNIDLVPAYAEAPLAKTFGVRCYAGSPITTPSGRLVGSLCGSGPRPMTSRATDQVERWYPVLQAQAELLGVEFERELDRQGVERGTDWESALRSRDKLTALPDRRGWALLLQREEERAAALAEPLGVIVVEVSGARTARAMRRTTAALTEVAEGTAQLTRIGGRQFGLVCPGLTSAQTEQLELDLAGQLRTARLASQSGRAMRAETDGTAGAWRRAEAQLLSARRTALAA